MKYKDMGKCSEMIPCFVYETCIYFWPWVFLNRKSVFTSYCSHKISNTVWLAKSKNDVHEKILIMMTFRVNGWTPQISIIKHSPGFELIVLGQYFPNYHTTSITYVSKCLKSKCKMKVVALLFNLRYQVNSLILSKIE